MRQPHDEEAATRGAAGAAGAISPSMRTSPVLFLVVRRPEHFSFSPLTSLLSSCPCPATAWSTWTSQRPSARAGARPGARARARARERERARARARSGTRAGAAARLAVSFETFLAFTLHTQNFDCTEPKHAKAHASRLSVFHGPRVFSGALGAGKKSMKKNQGPAGGPKRVDHPNMGAGGSGGQPTPCSEKKVGGRNACPKLA